jgi:aspartyl-tRNA(Asn)/glutamyl-tRNA(Gln) amidotransferase subunit A
VDDRRPDPFSGQALNAFITEIEAPGEVTRLAVKDLFDTAGVLTTYGSAVFREHVPKRTATAVQQLQDAGYTIVGKTNLHEFAYGITSENEHFGDVVNPLDPSRIPGGSSGGNGAALAAGLCEVALGTDSAGSIRIPAACCGVVGFKPTHGLVPTNGVFPLAPSFDHAGPMARSVGDCIAMVLDGLDVPPLPSLEEVAIAVAWTENAEPLLRERVEAAAALFPRRSRVDFPLPERFSPAFQREVADVHRDLFAEHGDLYGENVRTKIERCLAVTDDEVEASLAARGAYRERALEALGDADLLLTPTMGFVAPPVGIGDLALRENVIRFTRPFNSLGWPALALPCGQAEHGLPASLQVVGRPGADSLVLAVGELVEAALVHRPAPA